MRLRAGRGPEGVTRLPCPEATPCDFGPRNGSVAGANESPIVGDP